MSLVVLTTLALMNLARAGNVCVTSGGIVGPIGGTADTFAAFPAGDPCNAGVELNPGTEEFCDWLPQEIEICGDLATLERTDGPAGSGIECGVALSIQGTEYQPEVIDANPNDDPCCATCNEGIGFGVQFGEFHFVGVPICG